VKSYRTVRLGVPAKLKNLHSKIGRRVDFARVGYETTCMQSEPMRKKLRHSARAHAHIDRTRGAWTIDGVDG
jgi:hypothetical protein